MIAIALSLAQEARDPITGTNRIYFDRRSRENKCSYGVLKSVGRICSMQPICHRGRSEK